MIKSNFQQLKLRLKHQRTGFRPLIMIKSNFQQLKPRRRTGGYYLCLAVGWLLFSSPGLSANPWKALPVQDRGRIKPFDTLAREILFTVYGKETFKPKNFPSSQARPQKPKGKAQPLESSADRRQFKPPGNKTSEEETPSWSRGERRQAVDVVLSWMLIPAFWDTVPFILIESGRVKKALGLPSGRRRFSPAQLSTNQKLRLQLTELQALRQRKEPLDSYFKSLEKLETRRVLYAIVKTGAFLRIEPRGDGGWRSLPELSSTVREKFQSAVRAYIQWISVLSGQTDEDPPKSGSQKISTGDYSPTDPLPEKASGNRTIDPLPEKASGNRAIDPLPEKASDGNRATDPFTKNTHKKNDIPVSSSAERRKAVPSSAGGDFADQKKKDLKDALQALQREIFSDSPKNFSLRKIRLEVFLNEFKPFRKAWILYLLFLAGCLTVSFISKGKGLISLFYIFGLFSHIFGLVSRAYIMSRPPVTNMYETVVWVPLAGLMAGLFFYRKKNFVPFTASVILAFFCLFLTDTAPHILDSGLQPLEAVLRSNFWLSTHVLIITMSYAFFGLAFVLGDITLFRLLFQKTPGIVEEAVRPIYRLLQWGVVLLAGGTILGAIWADYSWGRFWGWDPKESWALVSLLGYLALLHGRFVGWIRPLSFVTGSVLMFFLILMAWYGVNFILGKGLHSYGFGTGGVEYVAGFFFFHILLCAVTLIQNRKIPAGRNSIDSKSGGK